jgi:integrase
VAKEILTKFEYDRLHGRDTLPTQTFVKDLLEAFAVHLRRQTGRTRKKGPQTDIYRLATWFGPICNAVTLNPQQDGRSQPHKGRRVGGGDKRHVPPLRIVVLEELTTELAADWLTRLAQKRNLNNKTANEYREVLCRFVNWAIARGVRMPGGSNPVDRVLRFSVATDRPIRFLKLEDIPTQLDALADRPVLQVMVAMLIYAGLRLGELLWLTKEDVDQKNGYLRVRRKIVLGREWTPKTGRERAVPISRALAIWLQVYQPPREVPWFFATPNNCQWDTDAFGEALRRVNGVVGLPWTALDFRHTFGSLLAMKGESLYKISQLLGNSPEICRRHYAALLPESLVDSVEFETNRLQARKARTAKPHASARNGSSASLPRGWRVVGADG